MLTEDYFAIINELKKTARPEGCIAMGAVCEMACRHGLVPDRALLETAAQVTEWPAVDACFWAWAILRGVTPPIDHRLEVQ